MKITITVEAGGKISRYDVARNASGSGGRLLGGVDARKAEATAVLIELVPLVRAVWSAYAPLADIEGTAKALIKFAEEMGMTQRPATGPDTDVCDVHYPGPCPGDETVAETDVEALRAEKDRWKSLAGTRGVQLVELKRKINHLDEITGDDMREAASEAWLQTLAGLITYADGYVTQLQG